MNITVKTAVLVMDNRETQLSRKIVEQLPIAEGEFNNNDRFKAGGDCKVLGEVQLDQGKTVAFEYWLIVATPKGVRRMDLCYKNALNGVLRQDGQPRIERIILLK